MLDLQKLSKHLDHSKWKKAKKRFLSGTIFADGAKTTGVGDVLDNVKKQANAANKALSRGRKDDATTALGNTIDEANKLDDLLGAITSDWDDLVDELDGGVKPRDEKRREQMEEYFEDILEAKIDLIEQCTEIEEAIEDIETGTPLKGWASGSKRADKAGSKDRETERLHIKFRRAETRLDRRFDKHFKDPFEEIAGDGFLHDKTVENIRLGIQLHEKDEDSEKEKIKNKKTALSFIVDCFKTKMGFTQGVDFTVSISTGFAIDVSGIDLEAGQKHSGAEFLEIKDELDELLEVVQDLQEDREKLSKLRKRYAARL
ncbi:MAG: hypothetical protein AAF598_07485 [Bacteroidota bacterium]